MQPLLAFSVFLSHFQSDFCAEAIVCYCYRLYTFLDLCLLDNDHVHDAQQESIRSGERAHVCCVYVCVCVCLHRLSIYILQHNPAITTKLGCHYVQEGGVGGGRRKRNERRGLCCSVTAQDTERERERETLPASYCTLHEGEGGAHSRCKPGDWGAPPALAGRTDTQTGTGGKRERERERDCARACLVRQWDAGRGRLPIEEFVGLL